MSGVIYALVDETGTPRYVGQTTKPLSHRLGQHRSTSLNGRTDDFYRWIQQCAEVSIIPLEVDPPDLDEAERRWIEQMRRGGVPLFNRTAGGRRAPTGLTHSPEAREKIGAARRGKPLSPEHRAKLSAAHTGVPIGDAHREAIGNGGRGLKRSDESRARLSASKMGDLNPMSSARRAERGSDGL